ncbi:hypothetical protein F7725_016060 [Dissostichus mawsoni]|uniref:Uncharacterized protein n=1 Tax=Dissostichus mawsoni TaxID=36200 RepID=A0A7J5Y3J9_DISMA|nr:hypothetical protein F7725_016060 [Dissostichus mawsoni]
MSLSGQKFPPANFKLSCHIVPPGSHASCGRVGSAEEAESAVRGLSASSNSSSSNNSTDRTQHVQLRLLNVCRVECQNFLPVSPAPPACPGSVSSSAAADSTLVGKPSLSALREEGGRVLGRRWEEGGGDLL